LIIDIKRFIDVEKPYWDELESLLSALDKEAFPRLTLAQVRRLYYLYRRVCTDVSRLCGVSVEPELRVYLESLAIRAYGEIHETRNRALRFNPFHWFFVTFPRTFRAHFRAFEIAAFATLLGAVFGGAVILVDPGAKTILLPYPELQQNPSERVSEEEAHAGQDVAGRQLSGSAFYMTHNTRVSIYVFALGITWGIGSIMLLFFNGVLLGVVAVDYIRAGETAFLLGWLLPHGAVEIPAILVAGQSSLVLGWALLGWKSREPLKVRLRRIGPIVVTFLLGVTLMLVWAGIVEAFFSQYHEPLLPYWVKILFGICELVLLILYFSLLGRPSSGSDVRVPSWGRFE